MAQNLISNDLKFAENGPEVPVTDPATELRIRIGLSPYSQFMQGERTMLQLSFSVRRCQTILRIHRNWHSFCQAHLLQLHRNRLLKHLRVLHHSHQHQEGRSCAMPVPKKAIAPKIVLTESLSKYLFEP